jgi:hypothetical protein
LAIWWPADGQAFNFNDISFGWQPDPYAITYHVQLDNDINFGSPLFNDSTIPNNYLYNYSFVGYADGPYYWRARGIGCAPGPWTNTMSIFRDTQAPGGSVASSPDTANATSFLVSWTAATDPPPSSGIMNYTVMFDSGTGYLGLIQTTGLSTTFTGARDGQTYRFAVFSQDNAVNVEFWNGQAECSTYVDLSGGGNCAYTPGDINRIGGPNGIDVVYGVTFLKGGTPPVDDCNPPCLTYTNPQPPYQQLPLANPFYGAMDVNGNCQANGIDITYFVAFLKGQQPALLHCPDCPPAAIAVPPYPAVMPIKSPVLNVKGDIGKSD